MEPVLKLCASFIITADRHKLRSPACKHLILWSLLFFYKVISRAISCLHALLAADLIFADSSRNSIVSAIWIPAPIYYRYVSKKKRISSKKCFDTMESYLKLRYSSGSTHTSPQFLLQAESYITYNQPSIKRPSTTEDQAWLEGNPVHMYTFSRQPTTFILFALSSVTCFVGMEMMQELVQVSDCVSELIELPDEPISAAAASYMLEMLRTLPRETLQHLARANKLPSLSELLLNVCHCCLNRHCLNHLVSYIPICLSCHLYYSLMWSTSILSMYEDHNPTGDNFWMSHLQS